MRTSLRYGEVVGFDVGRDQQLQSEGKDDPPSTMLREDVRGRIAQTASLRSIPDSITK